MTLCRDVLGAKMIPVIILVALIASGCGSAISHMGKVGTKTTANGEATTLGINDMLVGMHDKPAINSMSEAAAAFERANKTIAAVVPLIKEASRSGISANERADKNRAIAQLREQYNREMKPLNEFFKKVEREINKQ